MAQTFNAVTFRLVDGVFALDALKVREIVGAQVRQTLSLDGETKGFIQSRGKTVPVLDLREKFGLAKSEKEGPRSFIVVHPGMEKDRLVALQVDAAMDIIALPAEGLKPVAGPFMGIPGHLLQAVIDGPEGPVYVVNIEEVLAEGLTGESVLVLKDKAS
jgi:purine-binding chemotaxis protein CheW